MTRKCCALLLALVLLVGVWPGSAGAESAGTSDSAIFDGAMDYLLHVGSRESVQKACDLFAGISSGYNQSTLFANYAQVILDIYNKDFDVASFRLSVLQANDAFVQQLGQYALPSIQALQDYIEARRLEDSGDYVQAYDKYTLVMNWFDAVERMIAIYPMMQDILAQEPAVAMQARAPLAAGAGHTVAIQQSGRVLASGTNHFGETDVADWMGIISVAAGFAHTAALRQDGTVIATGLNEDGQCNVSAWQDVTVLSAGANCTIGITGSGSVLCTDAYYLNRLGVGAWQNVAAICAGWDYVAGLTSDGNFLLATDGVYDTSYWAGIMAIGGGAYHLVGLKNDGTCLATGRNDKGQCAVGGWKDITQVAAGADHTVGLRSNGTVMACGSNSFGQCNVFDWRDVVYLCAGDGFTIGLRRDGTVLAAGRSDLNQCDVTLWRDVVTP